MANRKCLVMPALVAAAIVVTTVSAASPQTITVSGDQTVAASAQGEPALSPAARNQIYTVDPATGQLSLHIPILTIPHSPRGPAIDYSLFYSASAGHPYLESVRKTSPADVYAWRNNPLGPWSFGGPMVEPSSSSEYTDDSGNDCIEHGPYVFRDSDGSAHDLGLVNQSYSLNGQYLCPDVQTTVSTETEDAFAIRSAYTFGGTPVVQLPDGETITFGQTCPGEGWCPTQIEDSNGNIVTVTYSGNTQTWTDATGKVALVVNFNGTGSEIGSIVTYDAAGNPETYTLTWSTIYGSGFTMPDPNDNNCPNPGECTVGQTVVSPGGNELTAMQLPDGTSYHFYYDPTYGALNEIVLPTGGQVAFTYTTTPPRDFYTATDAIGQDSIVYDMLAVSTVERGDGGTWTYSYGGTIIGDYASYTTSITDPAGQKTELTYNAAAVDSAVGGGNNFSYRGLEAQREIFSSSGALLRAVTTGHYLNYRPQAVQTTYADAGSGSLTSERDYSYDGYGNVIDEYDHDFASCGDPPPAPTIYMDPLSCSPGTLLRQTTRTFLTSYTSSPWIVDRAASETVSDGSGTTYAQTTYEYDNYSHTGQSMEVSGAAQHDSTYTTGYTARGNLTATTRWVSASNAPLTTTRQFDDAGNLLSSIDPAGNRTGYSYTDAWANSACAPASGSAAAYVTTITDALGHTVTKTYDSCTGSVATRTGPNGNTTKYFYADPGGLSRLTEVDHDSAATDPDCPSNLCAETTYSYTDSANAFSVETQRKIDSTRWTQGTEYFDSYGRSVVTASLNGSGTYDRVDTCYNNLDQVTFRAYPYSASGGANTPSCNVAGDSFQYDALGRQTLETHSDGSTFITSYAGPATETQDEGNGTSRVTRIDQDDALGRLADVCEVTANNPPAEGPAPSSCGLGITGTGFLTSYGYDVLNDLTGVTQGTETRSFAYDGLSRLTQSISPETGLTSYYWDFPTGGSWCLSQNVPSSNGDLIQRQDARGIATCYWWDADHRLIHKTYSDGTSQVNLAYDQTSYPGHTTLTNTIGRLSTENNGTSGKIVQYDAMGRLVDQWDGTPLAGPLHTGYAYDQAGDPTGETTYTGSTLSAAYDVAGRPTGLASSVGGTLISGITYYPDGQEEAATLGNGVSESRVDDARGRVTSIADGSAYSYAVPSGGYAPDSNMLSFTDSVIGGFNDTYNDLNQLTTALCTPNCSSASATYAYDRYGNRWSEQVNFTPPQTPENATFNNANNHLDGYSYDAAGDLLNDGTHSYAYDAEGRVTTVDAASTASYDYNVEGRRVHESVGGMVKEFLYASSGQELSVLDANQNLIAGETYIGGRYLGTQTPSGFVYAYQDALGNVRARSNGETDTNWPFGEFPNFQNGTSPVHYTGKLYDSESNLDYFGARYYSPTLGRFLTPDWSATPEAVPYGNLSNPQSLNLYSYVLNNPATALDPDGHKCCFSWFVKLVGGAYSATLGQALGIVSHPIATVQGLAFMVRHPMLALHGGERATVTVAQQILSGDPRAIGLGLGTIGMAIGTDGVGDAGDAADVTKVAEAGEAAVDANKLHHIFDDPGHGLDAVVSAYGSQEKAYAALQAATDAAAQTRGLAGEFNTTVEVGGQSVTVTGVVVNGGVRIGTAYIPKP